MPTIRLKGHFDGHVIQLDEPQELPRDVPLQVTVISAIAPTHDSTTDSVSTSGNALRVEPLSAARRAEIDAWIRDLSALVMDISDEGEECLQSAVADIRRQARDLARHGRETLP